MSKSVYNRSYPKVDLIKSFGHSLIPSTKKLGKNWSKFKFKSKLNFYVLFRNFEKINNNKSKINMGVLLSKIWLKQLNK